MNIYIKYIILKSNAYSIYHIIPLNDSSWNIFEKLVSDQIKLVQYS